MFEGTGVDLEACCTFVSLLMRIVHSSLVHALTTVISKRDSIMSAPYNVNKRMEEISRRPALHYDDTINEVWFVEEAE